jgi:exosortase E/protease (VPEID-CTERM system)
MNAESVTLGAGAVRTEEVPAARPFPPVRCAALLVVLLAEVLALTLRFDTAALGNASGWWAELLGQAHLAPRFAIIIGAATLAFSGKRLRDEIRELAQRSGATAFPWPLLCGHLAAFAGFAWLTAVVVEGDIGSTACPAAWVIAWLALALATGLSWAAVLLPAHFWLPLARRGSVALLTGILVGVAAWGFGWLTAHLWQPLGHLTLWAVQGLLSLVSPEVVCRPDEMVVGTPSFLVQIAPSCSGYEGIGLVWAFVAAYLWLSRNDLRFPQAFLLLPLGTAVIWSVNAVRITALIAIGSWGAPEVALGGFHSQAGALAFAAVALGLVVLAQRLRFFAAVPLSAGVPNPTAGYVAPLLALVAATMVTAAFASTPERLYPVRVLAVAAALWLLRHHYAGWQWSWSWPAVAIGVAAFALWMALEWAVPPAPGGAESAGGLAGLPGGLAALWLAFRVVGSVVAVPLAEELAFRGYLIRRLIARDFQSVAPGRFTWLSFLVSSGLFGLLHGRWLAGMLVGMLYALALYRRGKVGDAVLAHATTNALLAVYVLATESWSLWS